MSLHCVGGDPGAKGKNLVIREDGSVQNIGGKASVPVKPGVSATARQPCPAAYVHTYI